MPFPERADRTPVSSAPGLQLDRRTTPGPDTEVPANARALENIPTERLRALPPGQKPRSEREEIPGGFTKAQADRAERLELELAAIEEASRAPSDIQGTGSGAGCQAYWPSPHLVCGAIKDRYNAMGGPSSWLSWPNSPEYANPDGIGARSQFLNGSIYWSPSTGAHPVTILYMTKWDQLGWESGWLGYPTASETSYGPFGSKQEFQGAGLFWSQPTGVYAVGGAIRVKYDSEGGPGSFLGYPTSDEITTPDGHGRFNTFQNGAIYWSHATGAHFVGGLVHTLWALSGYEAGQYGYPVGAEYVNASGNLVQDFQYGTINLTQALLGANAVELAGKQVNQVVADTLVSRV